MTGLAAFVRKATTRPVHASVRAMAEDLAAREGAVAVLFYGSVLRDGEIGGVLDFYVLTSPTEKVKFGRRPWLWPRICFDTFSTAAGVLHAKVAVLPLATFRRAAAGRSLDTTIWTRFAQPSLLAFARDAACEAQVLDALADAARTAARFAAALGPAMGTARDYWSALFRQTYAAELRVEPAGRERQVLDAAPAYYDTMLPLAWSADGVAFVKDGGRLAPHLPPRGRRRLLGAWRVRRVLGKPLNAARLLRAALRTPGAVRYAAGKLARHRGLQLTVTPWRERHPLLAGLLAGWRLLRRRQPEAR